MKIRKRIQIGIEPLYFKRRYEHSAGNTGTGEAFASSLRQQTGIAVI